MPLKDAHEFWWTIPHFRTMNCHVVAFLHSQWIWIDGVERCTIWTADSLVRIAHLPMEKIYCYNLQMVKLPLNSFSLARQQQLFILIWCCPMKIGYILGRYLRLLIPILTVLLKLSNKCLYPENIFYEGFFNSSQAIIRWLKYIFKYLLLSGTLQASLPKIV